jgi:hypothetical protein
MRLAQVVKLVRVTGPTSEGCCRDGERANITKLILAFLTQSHTDLYSGESLKENGIWSLLLLLLKPRIDSNNEGTFVMSFGSNRVTFSERLHE